MGRGTSLLKGVWRQRRGSGLVWSLFESPHETLCEDQCIRGGHLFSREAIDEFVVGNHCSGRKLEFLVGGPI